MSKPTGAARFTPAFLESLRSVGDPPADEAVATFFHAADEGSAPYARLASSHEQDMDDDAFPGVGAFVRERPPWPAWADEARVREGQEVFGRWGLQLSVGLFLSSLPATYLCAKGTVPLVRTARLVSHPRRRILETGQMVIEAMAPGALVPGERGERAVRHVRLMHAAVRYGLTHPGALGDLGAADTEAWDDALGVPLNQEDLLGTLLAFSALGLDALERLGVSLGEREAGAYVHAWNVVGAQIGVRADLLPLSAADARAIATAILADQRAPSEGGRELMASTTAAVRELVGLGWLRGLPESGVRHFLGDADADLLGVGPANWTRHLLRAMRRLDGPVERFLTRLPGQHRLSALLGRRVVAGLEDVERGPGRPRFEISEELRDAWGVTSP